MMRKMQSLFVGGAVTIVTFLCACQSDQQQDLSSGAGAGIGALATEGQLELDENNSFVGEDGLRYYGPR